MMTISKTDRHHTSVQLVDPDTGRNLYDVHCIAVDGNRVEAVTIVVPGEMAGQPQEVPAPADDQGRPAIGSTRMPVACGFDNLRLQLLGDGWYWYRADAVYRL